MSWFSWLWNTFYGRLVVLVDHLHSFQMLRWVCCSFIELSLLPIFLPPLFLGLLQVMLAEFHKPFKLTVRLQHSNAFHHTMLALHALWSARGPLFRHGTGCPDSNKRVSHLVLILNSTLLINFHGCSLLKFLHGHVLSSIRWTAVLIEIFNLRLDSVGNFLRGLESFDSFLQGCIKYRMHAFLLLWARSTTFSWARTGLLRSVLLIFC